MGGSNWVYSNGSSINLNDLYQQMGSRSYGVGMKIEPDQDKFYRELRIQSLANELGCNNKSEQSINKNLLLLEDV